jgi:ATP-dependent helicase/nuclease subunit A
MVRLTDHQQNALSLDEHISLTANAGSGKTFVLAKRYLDIALKKDIALNNIAAITFTDKAAGELYKKISKEIDELINSTEDHVLIQKLERIRRQLVHANISTIHSFCIDILKEYPVEAGIDANFTPIDQMRSEELIELSVEEVISELLNGEIECKEIKYLIRLFASKNMLKSQLIGLVNNRKNILAVKEKHYEKDVEEIAINFHDQFINSLQPVLLENLPLFLESIKEINLRVLNFKKINSLALEARGLIDTIEISSPKETVIKLKELKKLLFTKECTLKKRDYLPNKETDGLEGEIRVCEEFIANINKVDIQQNHHVIERELATFGKNILYVFELVLNRYEEKKYQEGVLDFEDIQLFTRKILAEEGVRETISEKYKYLMVDEYQDTNEIQYQIFLPILDELKKGNLFIVGDEKQSIYSFRDAELEIFQITRDKIEESGSKKLLSLPDSFRMAPKLCAFTNHLFRRLFAKPNQYFNEVEHADLVYARNDDEEGYIEIIIAGVDEAKKEISEADLVSKKIISIINRCKYKWKDVTILCRKRDAFSEIESAFIKRKIPYNIVGGKGFYQKQPIYDIYSYFSFLLDDNNDAALVAILRSPFFLFSDSELYEMSLISHQSWFKKLKIFSLTSEKGKRALAVLEDNLKLIHISGMHYIIRKVITETGYLASLASRANGKQEVANIEKLIKETNKYFSQPFVSLFDYVEYLKESIESVEDESQAAIVGAENTVKIMTLHQAKGLEFPVVFLYDCGATTPSNSVKSKSITVSKKFGILTKVPVDENYFADYESAPINCIENIIESRKESAELKRLLYVGITRAKDELYISNNGLNRKKGSFWALISESLDVEADSEKINLREDLVCLVPNEEGYENKIVSYEMDIEIIKELEEIEVEKKEEGNSEIIYDFNLETISDTPKGEIISATKYAVYTQCPLKYKLTYEIGAIPLVKLQRASHYEYEFNNIEQQKLLQEEEERRKGSPEAKGRIIHYLLQKNVSLSDYESQLKAAIQKEGGAGYNSEFIENISNDLKNFCSSEVYLELSRSREYKNEMEVYLREEDFYLYGIIDKIIFSEDKITIIDYKTDDISADKIKERGKNYIPQLRFYSYIINKIYPEYKEYELKLVFIKHPSEPEKIIITNEDFASIKLEINQMVSNIREQNFRKNTGHCTGCLFYLNECIIKSE